ncbi:hypothetical protein [Pseudomonas sp. LD120]|uniref:hypothetical protein n=1 Tax=Pseudomonas sp. LD120 TaxID=485751 RepID=UPI001356F956|nr:hypothetical protein [Pseudomonas sp. LD120]KAF0863116.1 hypothetical protein PLD_20850 [Pseudomonas sp. LD120]
MAVERQSISPVGALLLLALGNPCLAMTLDEQFANLATCGIENVYLDPNDHQPQGEYFVERQLQPCELDEAARYCIDDTYQGLAVRAVLIPYSGPFSVHALYLKDSVASVRRRLGRTFFGDGRQRPLLSVDRQHPGGSVLYCDPQSQ